jgi:6-phosphogluconolactonase (cycloisomerase 2 family)
VSAWVVSSDATPTLHALGAATDVGVEPVMVAAVAPTGTSTSSGVSSDTVFLVVADYTGGSVAVARTDAHGVVTPGSVVLTNHTGHTPCTTPVAPGDRQASPARRVPRAVRPDARVRAGPGP